ncbi:MAG: hypothetical protein ABSH49_35655, partial [Bryobacteraceae bacterium]
LFGVSALAKSAGPLRNAAATAGGRAEPQRAGLLGRRPPRFAGERSTPAALAENFVHPCRLLSWNARHVRRRGKAAVALRRYVREARVGSSV